ncbi:hypothetical protein SLEP1_g25612 [Rubroshorea leprosula]|uniref:Uncharacterized protein n=1 Tax=Rubroshorea leprosula TaxID=152421 RepID=A0AAV5JJS7_9ROSI|nr:hypothetical protein SLEP1_g25612 [Rubroshorea leprosula]
MNPTTAEFETEPNKQQIDKQMELNRSMNPTVAGFKTEPSACWVRNQTQHFRTQHLQEPNLNTVPAGFEPSTYAFFIFIHLQKPNGCLAFFIFINQFLMHAGFGGTQACWALNPACLGSTDPRRAGFRRSRTQAPKLNQAAPGSNYESSCHSQQYNSYPNTCHFDPNTSWNNEDILEPQSGFQAPEETCLNKNLEVQSSNLLNLVAEEIQGELPSATMKNQEEEVNTLPLEIEGQLGEVEIMLAETKQEDVPMEEEEKAQVSFEVFNGESPLTKSDFNDYFVIDMVDEILQKNTYEDPFEIYPIQAKNSIKEYINCLNTSSSLESKGAFLEELGRHIYWPKPKQPQNSH